MHSIDAWVLANGAILWPQWVEGWTILNACRHAKINVDGLWLEVTWTWSVVTAEQEGGRIQIRAWPKMVGEKWRLPCCLPPASLAGYARRCRKGRYRFTWILPATMRKSRAVSSRSISQLPRVFSHELVKPSATWLENSIEASFSDISCSICRL